MLLLAGRPPAVNKNGVAGNIIWRLRGKINQRSCQVILFGQTPKGYPVDNTLVYLFIFQNVFIHIGFDVSGPNGININVVASPLQRQGLG